MLNCLIVQRFKMPSAFKGSIVQRFNCSKVQLFKMPSAFKGSGKLLAFETKNSILKINKLIACRVQSNGYNK